MLDGYPTGGDARGGAIPWLFGGALIIVAIFAIAFAVMLTGNSAPSGPGHHQNQQALPAASSPVATGPAQPASPSASAHKSSHTASPNPAPTFAPVGTNPAPTHNAPVHLAATVSAKSWHHSQDAGQVFFKIADIGSASTGQLTVSITLPAGASIAGNGGGGGDATLNAFDSGWNCQPASTGATCTHAGIAAGSQTVGVIFYTLNGGSVCGQVIDLRVASGSAVASAQSTVAC